MNENHHDAAPTAENDTVETLGKAAATVAATVATGMAAAGCSGSSGGGFVGGLAAEPVQPLPNQPAAPAVGGTIEASRFLTQATFGPSQADIDELIAIGYNTWFQRQFNETGLSSHLGRAGFGEPPASVRQEAFFAYGVNARDQLRQRVAFSLGQIFVISDNDLSGNQRTLGLARYHDLLAQYAFGNFRELLEAVTLSPMMGEYLSMVRNERPDPTRNIRPDENYAREIMQLFTIGLVNLNIDGTITGGAPGTPTYDQTDIEGLAHVFTGWNWAGSPPSWYSSVRNYIDPMEPNENFHDTGAKTFLGITIPAGGTAQSDLTAALDNIFNHPNVPPFISKQLIQRLVTSNPTPAYVQRVATVFQGDSQGVRGNLAAVIRAILLDTEARNGHTDITIPAYGKLREPLVRLIALWRAFRASSFIGTFNYTNPQNDFSQAFQRSPTVFNFFRPEFSQPGPIAAGGHVSPEFQIFTESIAVTSSNEFYDRVFRSYVGFSNLDLDDIVINFQFEMTLADDPPALVAHLNVLLMGGAMSNSMRIIVESLVTDTALSSTGIERVLEAVFIIVTSPEYSVQR